MRLFLAASLLLLAACSSASDRSNADYTTEDAAATTADAAAPADDYVEAATDTVSDTVEQQLPEFSLPAPQPSARANLPRSLFGNPATVGDIGASLAKALDRNGYDHVSYYRVPGGFALITETERIHDDGSPYPGQARWIFQAAPLLSLGSLFNRDFPSGFLQGLRNADPGRYRVLVFLVTTRVVTSGTTPVTFETAQKWPGGGGDYLPPSIAGIRLTPNHNASVLVYEFRRASVSAAPGFVAPSGLSARQHLTASHLLQGT